MANDPLPRTARWKNLRRGRAFDIQHLLSAGRTGTAFDP
jgi:hypothetical protein